MSEAQRKLKDRIRRLRELTEERGCTEAEALAAAEKAAQLMRDHGLSDADIVMDEQSSSTKNKGGGQKARLWPVIAHCTNTASIVITRRDGADVAFIGREPGPEIAVYLRDVCERAIDRELRRFKLTKLYRRQRKPSSRRETAAAFVAGMVDRLSRRLIDVFGPSTSAEARGEADRALAERYNAVDLPRPKAPQGRWDAQDAGSRAGDAVTLSHGVGGAANEPLQIGART